MKVQLIANGSKKWQRMIKRWGVSFLIGEDVLFDTFGDKNFFLNNVKKQKIDLSKIRHIVISHDDWDHVGGLWFILERCKNLTVYVGPHFSLELKDRIRSYGVSLVEVQGPTQITNEVYSTGELMGETSRGTLYEQSVVIKHEDSVGIIMGCAHPKVPHIVKVVKDFFHLNVDTIVGGFHLKDSSPEYIKEVVKGLPRFGVRIVVPLHCTGTDAVKEFKRFYLKNCLSLSEGESLEV